MYYITNEQGWVIAADERLLRMLGVDDMEALYRAVATGHVTLPQQEHWELGGETYRCDTTRLQSPFGTWYQTRLVRPEIDEETTVQPRDEEPIFDLIEETPQTEPSVATESETIGAEAVDLADDDTLLDLGLDTEPLPQPAETRSSPEPLPEEDLVDLILPTEGEVRVDTIAPQEETPPTDETPASVTTTDTRPFDPERHAATIGVDVDDYLRFVDEYAQTASGFASQLLSDDSNERTMAIARLRHLGGVLQLDEAVAALETLRDTPSQQALDDFLRITASYTGQKEASEATQAPSVSSDHVSDTNDTAQTEVQPTEAYRYDPIDLSDVDPIHFDFTIEEAANDLSLPSELIEEFIMDFIKQAHEETERMIEAYRKGDLETVQKIGHLLKGTSSNLRITPLADTLYEIQFNEDIERVPELVRNYWGHFLSLENQMKLLSK